jgi:hypothetical protein
VISHVWGRGLYPQFFAYMYYPIFILFINYYFDRKQIIFLCFNLIISFVLSAAMGNPSYFVSLWVLVFCFWLYKSTERKLNYLELTNQLIVLVTFFVGWVAINSWWLSDFVSLAAEGLGWPGLSAV